MAIMDPGRTPNNTIEDNTTNTQKCGPGQVLRDGVCVTLGMQGGFTATSGREGAYNPFPNGNPFEQNQTQTQTPNGLSQAYSNIRSGFQQATDTNIAAARQTAEMQQQELARQLEQQREDYLKNRQTLQKETFLRGRNVLANLANRGLATSGLQQLGDIQRTIATGQQMNELSSAFERARQGLTSQQTQVATGLQQFEAGQQSQLAQQLAGLDLQQAEAVIPEAGRLLGSIEDAISAAGSMTPEQASIYQSALDAYNRGDTATLTNILAQTGTGDTTDINTAFGANAQTIPTASLISTIQNYTNISQGESEQVDRVLSNSEYLQPNSPLIQILQTNKGQVPAVAVADSRAGKGGMNDTYRITFPNGDSEKVPGRELISLLMSGQIKLSKEDAIRLVQRRDGQIVTARNIWGNEYDAFVKPYLKWLQEQNYIRAVQTTSSGDVGFGTATAYQIIG
jgi:hypothetical protein